MTNVRKVAAKAGVSAATVSRAFKNSELLSQETKEKVLKIARSLGYYPDKNLRGPKPKQYKTVGFLVPREEKEKLIYNAVNFYTTVFAGLKEAMDEYEGRILNISYANTALPKEIDKIDWREIQGLAIIHTSFKDDEFIKRNRDMFKAPFIVLNRKFPDETNVNYLCADEELGGYEAATYLGRLGHKRIACLALWQDFAYLQERVNGYKRAMKELWANNTPGHLIGYCQQPNDSYEQTKKLLKREKRISAIFLNEEDLVPGLFKALEELGKRVPEDISIMAYNDYTFTISAKPQLSTIRLPTYEMGYLVGRILQDMERVATRGIFRIVLSPQLIERSSCRKR